MLENVCFKRQQNMLKNKMKIEQSSKPQQCRKSRAVRNNSFDTSVLNVHVRITISVCRGYVETVSVQKSAK